MDYHCPRDGQVGAAQKPAATLVCVASFLTTLTDIVLDAARFRQVSYNYISNALKFTPQTGLVLISLQQEVASRPATPLPRPLTPANSPAWS